MHLPGRSDIDIPSHTYVPGGFPQIQQFNPPHQTISFASPTHTDNSYLNQSNQYLAAPSVLKPLGNDIPMTDTSQTQYQSHQYDQIQTPHLQEYHYPPPQVYRPRINQTLFRYKTKQTIPLTEFGNLVVDVPVPQKVLATTNRVGLEFTHLRYSAVVGDPNDFQQGGFSLRQFEVSQSVEIFIVVTMYNEDQNLFLKTWNALQRNIQHLCSKKKSDVWGPDGWKKVVVCIVSDGRTKINPKTLAVIGLLGIYQEGLIKTSIEDKPVTAHLFEYSTQVSLDSSYSIKKPSANAVPIQVMFCLKEKNAKKINSHRWFFNAFGPLLKPNVCILIDVGTKPTDKSIYYLWKEFHLHPHVGGACGEIYAEQGIFGSKLLNPLVAAQNFEYKMSNILDKPLESVFGFISVLPGAFSAYRYAALLNGPNGEGPLEKYFLGEKMHGGANLIIANMYLAEDRILCFELVTKRNQSWVLRYVQKAKAETDVPDSVPEYVSQRRRWLNGSFFAGLHAIIHFYQIFRSGHDLSKKITIIIQLLYNIIVLIFNWFAIGCFYLTFTFLIMGVVTQRETDPFGGAGVGITIVFKYLYLFSLVMIFVASLGNRPQSSKILYTGSFILFAIIMIMMLYVTFFTITMAINAVVKSSPERVFTSLLTNSAFRDIFLSLLSTFGIYWAASIIFMDPWHMITSFIQYLLLVPSFVNILMVYAFCNLHDVSWGTKGDNQVTESAKVQLFHDASGNQMATMNLPVEQGDIDETYSLFFKELSEPPEKDTHPPFSQDDYFKAFRTRLVLFWMLSNTLLVAIFTTPQVATLFGMNISDVNEVNPFLTFFLWSTTIMTLIRFIGCFVYKIQRSKEQKRVPHA
ncbi:chitin synthase-domain-containing protein [Globomyces pollinis-pini]|nr:chitin synthase-domain-containing protein [Globomyces pollinis-pini]